jgi:hypothetical protein
MKHKNDSANIDHFYFKNKNNKKKVKYHEFASNSACFEF